MLDYRAWIIAVLILASAAGAYLVWLRKPRAQYAARSLTAAPAQTSTPAKPGTKSLHVDGCKDDFIVDTGEVVEPRIVPDASQAAFRALYGKETKRLPNGALTWNIADRYTLTDGNSNANESADKSENYVSVALNQGHVVETLDGIELGLDSFGAIYRKMRDRKVELHERIDHVDAHVDPIHHAGHADAKGPGSDTEGSNGSWIFTLSLYSSCGRKYRSEYSRTLPSDPETDREIDTIAPDGHTHILKPGPFLSKVVYNYTLLPSNGHDESQSPAPTEHN